MPWVALQSKVKKFILPIDILRNMWYYIVVSR